MKPLGRRNRQVAGSKQKPKENGKNVLGWWEIIDACKKRDRREAKKEIKREL